jgi:hypothetical protein
MNRPFEYLLALVLCAAIAPLSSVVASANSHSRLSRVAAMDRPRDYDAPDEKWERDPIVFSRHDREAIRMYYRNAGSRRRAIVEHRVVRLVPRNRLQRNSTVPLTSQNRLEPLPTDVERSLQSLYSGYSRGMIGPDAVIVQDRTQRIMDIIHNVTGRR